MLKIRTRPPCLESRNPQFPNNQNKSGRTATTLPVCGRCHLRLDRAEGEQAQNRGGGKAGGGKAGEGKTAGSLCLADCLRPLLFG